MDATDATFTAFSNHICVAAGSIEAVIAVALAHPIDASPLQIFDDQTGAHVDLNLRDGAIAAIADYRARTGPPLTPAPTRGRGRPRLGVVPREVTLLPRHWEWLATQSGGASATLRRLVEQASRSTDGADDVRRQRATTYKVMSALAGDLPGFEAASRALFAGDSSELERHLREWPADVASYLLRVSASR